MNELQIPNLKSSAIVVNSAKTDKMLIICRNEQYIDRLHQDNYFNYVKILKYGGCMNELLNLLMVSI